MEQTLPNTEGLTFEKVWAMFQELREDMKETDRRFQETAQRFQETDRQFKETDRKISKLGSRIGELVEQLTASNLPAKFRELGYEFSRISHRTVIKNEHGRLLAEIDLLLENGDYVMVVEVKSLFSREDVTDHLKRMQVVKDHAALHGDRRNYLGAAAAALIEDDIRDYALQKGLYVIEQTGDTVKISAPKQKHVW